MGYSGDRLDCLARSRKSEGKEVSRTARQTDNISLERRAAELHALSRRRTDLFNRPVMADTAMDIMLTALIAHEQGTVLTRLSAAMANRLPLASADSMIEELIGARLLRHGDRRDQINPTQLGVDLMREFVSRASVPQRG